jgi:hypothetical protein
MDGESDVDNQEYFPHARSVAHQMILLPARIRTPSATHAERLPLNAPEPSMMTGRIIAR